MKYHSPLWLHDHTSDYNSLMLLVIVSLLSIDFMNNKDIALLLAFATGGILVGYLVGRNKTTRSQ